MENLDSFMGGMQEQFKQDIADMKESARQAIMADADLSRLTEENKRLKELQRGAHNMCIAAVVKYGNEKGELRIDNGTLWRATEDKIETFTDMATNEWVWRVRKDSETSEVVS
ncbi:hypothetical protein LCGC14_2461070 [marine sediment metagenome]|uniref:Uncharacterized protein n=1 Tax=marine sediment metagenome TaxID=412755 RepID=A0A0F9DQD3_9ZZZZ